MDLGSFSLSLSLAMLCARCVYSMALMELNQKEQMHGERTEIKTTDFLFLFYILIDTKHVLYRFYCVAYVYLVKVHNINIVFVVRPISTSFLSIVFR